MALSALQREIDTAQASALLESLPAEARVEWALENLPGSFVLSSSFGIQSAVLLHLATRIVPDLPVLLVDTGYLFPETYRFVDELTERLNRMVLQNKVDQLAVIADPSTLGVMRKNYHKMLEQRLVKELPKTLTSASAEEIARALA